MDELWQSSIGRAPWCRLQENLNGKAGIECLVMDIVKHISFLRNSAYEDLEVARDLIHRKRVRHGLFFAHLALEKILKAIVTLKTQDFPPRLHNLIRLVELAKLDMQQMYKDTLAEMNAFNIEGRYPDTLSTPPSQEEAEYYMDKTERVFQWLIKQL